MFYPWDEESNRPFPLVTQGAEYAKEKILKAGKKLLSKNIAPPCRVESISPIGGTTGGESFGFRIFPAEDKISSWRPLLPERSGRFNSESGNRF